MQKNNKNAVPPREIAALGALSLFLGAIEYLIPKPLPAFRLGLANLPLLLALRFPVKDYAALACIKSLGQCLLSGTLFSPAALLSVCGTAASALVMRCLSRLPSRLISLVGISLGGSLASTFVQLVLAGTLIFGAGVRYLAPPLIAAGSLTGIALGVFCEKFVNESKWLIAGYHPSLVNSAHQRSASGRGERGSPIARLSASHLAFCVILPIAAAAMLAAPCLANGTEIQLAMFAFFWIAALLKKKAGNPLLTAFYFMVIVFINLITPYGREIAVFGPLRITEGALKNALGKAALVQGLLLASRTFLPRDLPLPGVFGALFAETLTTLSKLTEAKKKFSLKQTFAKNPFTALDALLFELAPKDAPVFDGLLRRVTRNEPNVEIFYVDVSGISEDELPRYESMLPPDEAAAAAEFNSFKARRDRVFGRLLIYRVLGGGNCELGIAENCALPPSALPHATRSQFPTHIQYTKYGKPYIDGAACFNVSHSGGIVCAAFAGFPVGVDVERRRNVKIAAPEAFFCQAESEFLQNANNDDFLRLWTRKEALLKALGTGFCADAASLNCLEDYVGVDGEFWQIENFSIHDDFFCALCFATGRVNSITLGARDALKNSAHKNCL